MNIILARSTFYWLTLWCRIRKNLRGYSQCNPRSNTNITEQNFSKAPDFEALAKTTAGFKQAKRNQDKRQTEMLHLFSDDPMISS